MLCLALAGFLAETRLELAALQGEAETTRRRCLGESDAFVTAWPALETVLVTATEKPRGKIRGSWLTLATVLAMMPLVQTTEQHCTLCLGTVSRILTTPIWQMEV